MVFTIILYGIFAGITVFIGGVISRWFSHLFREGEKKTELNHFILSFGSGIMLSAVALVLVPRPMKNLNTLEITIFFLLGSIAFLFIDIFLSKKKGKAATVLAMMMDFIPESLALGSVFAIDRKTALLLSIIIGVQNLPEAFNAYSDLSKSNIKPNKILILFFFLSFSGVIGVLLGHFVLSSHQILTSYLMIFSSGGILYLLVQDIIPDSKLENHFVIPLGSILGFLVGIVSNMIV